MDNTDKVKTTMDTKSKPRGTISMTTSRQSMTKDNYPRNINSLLSWICQYLHRDKASVQRILQGIESSIQYSDELSAQESNRYSTVWAKLSMDDLEQEWIYGSHRSLMVNMAEHAHAKDLGITIEDVVTYRTSLVESQNNETKDSTITESKDIIVENGKNQESKLDNDTPKENKNSKILLSHVIPNEETKNTLDHIKADVVITKQDRCLPITKPNKTIQNFSLDIPHDLGQEISQLPEIVRSCGYLSVVPNRKKFHQALDMVFKLMGECEVDIAMRVCSRNGMNSEHDRNRIRDSILKKQKEPKVYDILHDKYIYHGIISYFKGKIPDEYADLFQNVPSKTQMYRNKFVPEFQGSNSLQNHPTSMPKRLLSLEQYTFKPQVDNSAQSVPLSGQMIPSSPLDTMCLKPARAGRPRKYLDRSSDIQVDHASTNIDALPSGETNGTNLLRSPLQTRSSISRTECLTAGKRIPMIRYQDQMNTDRLEENYYLNDNEYDGGLRRRSVKVRRN